MGGGVWGSPRFTARAGPASARRAGGVLRPRRGARSLGKAPKCSKSRNDIQGAPIQSTFTLGKKRQGGLGAGKVLRILYALGPPPRKVYAKSTRLGSASVKPGLRRTPPERVEFA